MLSPSFLGLIKDLTSRCACCLTDLFDPFQTVGSLLNLAELSSLIKHIRHA